MRTNSRSKVDKMSGLAYILKPGPFKGYEDSQRIQYFFPVMDPAADSWSKSMTHMDLKFPDLHISGPVCKSVFVIK